MADLTTYEQAKQCPKCHEYGTFQGSQPGPRPGSKVETYACGNELCLWHGEAGWIIQINADGSIPNRTQGPKEFPVLPDSQRQAYDDYFTRLAAEDREGR